MTAPADQDQGLLPRPVRASLLALLAAIVGVAAYLMMVRGPVVLFDLAANTFRAICF